jgi:hypothetical protein
MLFIDRVESPDKIRRIALAEEAEETEKAKAGD